MKNVIQEDLINHIVNTNYGLQPMGITAINTGVRNKSFVISTPNKKYVLRIYASNRTKEHIVYELDAMNLLRKKRLPVPYITPALNGELLSAVIIEDQERNVILMDFIDGESLSSKNIQMLTPLARLQARMHRILKDNLVPRKSINAVLQDWSRWSKEEREKMKPILGQYGLEQPYLEAFDEMRHKTELLYDKITEVPYTECHNDFFGNNIIIKDDKINGIIDFDNLTTTPIIFDVANTLFSWLFHNYPNFDPTVINIYIESYQSERQLSKLEIELLIPLIAIRNFAVTNSLYTHNFIEGHERIDKTTLFHKNVTSQLLSHN